MRYCLSTERQYGVQNYDLGNGVTALGTEFFGVTSLSLFRMIEEVIRVIRYIAMLSKDDDTIVRDIINYTTSQITG